ncbi:MAG: DedA family protein [Chlamydiales bacterium]|nr:DedA family protein [Chlamydiales bacterium]
MGIDIIIIGFIYQYPHHAYWIIFISLILAGFNLPISEDLMLVTSGWLASAVIPEHALKLWIAVFAGAFLSDWIAYWTGRLLGPRLLTMRWISKVVKQERIDKMHKFYEKWGFFAFLVGRFVPFGVRNCLFISAGMGHMSFPKFLLIDGVAALCSTTSAFYLAYTFGQHYEPIWEYIKTYDIAFISAIAIVLVTLAGIIWYNKTKRVTSQ